MSEKTNNYKGYILLESLVALGLLCLIVGSYMSLNGFLLKKNKQTEDKLSMQRILYEEIKHHENYGGQLSKEMNTENKSYQLQLDTTNDMLVEVEITDGKELFTIKKE